MENKTDSVVGKFEEKFIRRLGEIAILLHLAKSPEGSHAYEMRSKASEILFEKRKTGAEFLQNHINLLYEMKKLFSLIEAGATISDAKREEMNEKMENCPIFSFNLRFQHMLSKKYEFKTEDLDYIDELISALEESVKEMKDTSVIWSNISGIYPTIDSLEKNGLIKFIREDPEGGRLKKIYSITEVGRQSLSKVMTSLLDISAFFFETERKHIFHKTEGILSSRLLPFQKVFTKLSEELSPDFMKNIHKFKGDHTMRPFIHMMMDQGFAIPRLNVLVNHPEMLEEHLAKSKSEDERNMLKTFIKNRLIARRKMIDKLLENL